MAATRGVGGGWRRWLLASTALLPFAAQAQSVAPNAMPTGGQVTAGAASIAQGGATTTINQSSSRAAIDWQRFNVGRDHTVRFNQPNAAAWTLNRVNAPDPSVIAGGIQANGGVALVNRSGVVFTGTAQVNVGALIASAANITNQNFMAGNMVFDGAPNPGAKVENHGTIATTGERGLVALVGPRVGNTGVIRARLGRVALAGAETFRLDLAGDGLLGIDVTQAVRTAPDGGAAIVTNSGTIEAPGGSVLLTAHAVSGLVEDLVRNTGRIAAPTVAGRTGEVALVAEGGGVRIEGRVAATGGAGAAGGRVTARATGKVEVAARAVVDVSGGGGGGGIALGDATTGRVRVAGQVLARGTGSGAKGGRIAVQARDAVTIASGALVDASGVAGGGAVLLGTTGFGRDQVMAAEVVVEAGATVRADAMGSGDGGTIAINSLSRTEMRGLLSARGGPAGGNGGFVEVSAMGAIFAPDLLRLVDVGAPAGRAGALLLDPAVIIINATGGDTLPPGGIGAGDRPGDTITLAAGDISGFGGDLLLAATEQIVLEAGGAVNKTNGNLTLQTTGASTDAGITIDDAIILGTGTLALISNSSIAVTATGSLTATAGATNLTAATTITLQGNVTAAQSSSIVGSGGITLGANVDVGAGNTLTLRSNGAITQSGGILTAGTVDARGVGGGAAVAGTISLNASNAVANFAAASSGSVSFASIAAVLNVGAITAGGGAITLRADQLNLTAALSAGTVNLLPLTAGTAVTLGNSGAPAGLHLDATELGFVQTAGGVLRIGGDGSATTAGAITVVDDVTLANAQAARLDLRGASVAQTGGAVSVGTVGGNTSAGFSLDRASNAIGAVEALSAGRITVVTTTALDVRGSVTASAGFLNLTAGGLLTLVSGATVSANADSTLAGGGGITLNAGINVGGNRLTLTSEGVIQQDAGGIITAGTLSANNASGAVDTDAIALLAAANAVDSFSASSNGGVGFGSTRALTVTGLTAGAASTLRGISGLTLSGAISTPGAALALLSSGAISQTAAGVITAATLSANNAGGAASDAIALGAADNLVASVTAQSAGDVTFRSAAAQALTVTGITAGAGRTITLEANALTLSGDLAASGGVVALRRRTAGAITVGDSGAPSGLYLDTAALDRVRTAGGTLRIGDSGGSAGAITVTGNIRLRGGTGEGNAARLELFGTSVAQAGGTRVDVASLGGGTTGAFALDSTANTIGAVGGLSGSSVAVTTTTALGVDDVTATGGGITLTAGGALTVNAAATVTATADSVLTGASIALAGTLGVGANTLALRSTGAITQTAGTITALTVDAAGIGGGAAASGAVMLDQANAVDRYAVLSNDAVTLRSSRAVTLVAAAGDPTVSVRGTSVAVTSDGASGGITVAAAVRATAGALTLTVQNDASPDGAIAVNAALTATGDVALSGRSIATTAPITSSGGTITLEADAMALAGDANTALITTVAGGTATLRRRSDGAISLGADGPGTALNLTTDELNRIRTGAGVLRIGAIGAAANTLVVAGDIRLRGGAGQVNAARLDLLGSAVTQSGGMVDVAAVSGRAEGGGGVFGAFSLDRADNRLDTIDGIVAATVDIRSDASLSVNGAVVAEGAAGADGTVRIDSAGTLTVAASVDAIEFDAATEVTSLLRGDAGLTLGASVQVGARNRLELRSSGNVTQDTFRIVAGTVDVGRTDSTRAGAISLSRPTNQIGRFSGRSTLAIDVVSDIALTVDHLLARASASVTAAGITLAGEIDLGTDAGGNPRNVLTLRARDAGAIVQSGGSINADTVDARAESGGPASAIELDRSNVIANFTGSAVAGVSVASNRALVVSGLEAGADSSVSAAAITLAGDVTIGGGAGLTLRGDGAIAQVGGRILAGRLGIGGRFGANAGSVALGGANAVERIAIAANGGVAFATTAALTVESLAAGAASRITAGGALTLAGDVVLAGGASVALVSGGALDQAGGRIVAGGVDATATSVTLTAAGNAIDRFGGTAAGDVSVVTGGALTVGNIAAGGALRVAAAGRLSAIGATLIAGGALTLQGNGLVVSGATLRAGGLATLDGGGDLRITSTTVDAVGDLRLLSTGAFAVDALVARAGLAVDLDGDATLIGSSLTAGTTLTVRTDGVATLLRSSFQAEVARFVAARMVLADVTLRIGEAVLFQAPGGIVSSGPVTVRGLDAARLPAVVFDTRAAPLVDPLTQVLSDRPGRPANQQLTQVRAGAGSDQPGAFGRASSAGAGSLVLDLDAGGSAVFALLDGGAASGRIIAGRLGIHGVGGRLELTGTLGGVGGAEAAQFADITRPVDSGALQSYRINGCVVSAINCVVTPRLQPLITVWRDAVDLRLQSTALNPSEVTISNFGENDYE